MLWLVPLLPLMLGLPIAFRLVAHVIRSRFTSGLSLLLRPGFAIFGLLALAGVVALYAYVFVPFAMSTPGEPTAEMVEGEVPAVGAFIVCATIVTSLVAVVVLAIAVPTTLLAIDGRLGTVRYGHVVWPGPLRVIEHIDRVGRLSVGEHGRRSTHVDLWGANNLYKLTHSTVNGNRSSFGSYSEKALNRFADEVNAYVDAFRAHDDDTRREQRRVTREQVGALVDARKAESERREADANARAERATREKQARTATAAARKAARRERKLAKKFRS